MTEWQWRRVHESAVTLIDELCETEPGRAAVDDYRSGGRDV